MMWQIQVVLKAIVRGLQINLDYEMNSGVFIRKEQVKKTAEMNFGGLNKSQSYPEENETLEKAKFVYINL